MNKMVKVRWMEREVEVISKEEALEKIELFSAEQIMREAYYAREQHNCRDGYVVLNLENGNIETFALSNTEKLVNFYPHIEMCVLSSNMHIDYTSLLSREELDEFEKEENFKLSLQEFIEKYYGKEYKEEYGYDSRINEYLDEIADAFVDFASIEEEIEIFYEINEIVE